MQIHCYSIEDFITNLEDGTIYNTTIYFNRTLRSLTKDSVREATSVEVGIQASAVITYEDEEAQALIEAGETCGIDRRTADGGFEGTERFTSLLKLLQGYCDRRQLRLRPGVLGI